MRAHRFDVYGSFSPRTISIQVHAMFRLRKCRRKAQSIFREDRIRTGMCIELLSVIPAGEKVITIAMSESFNDIVVNMEIILLPGQVHGNEGCAGDDMSSFSCTVLCESV